MLDGSKPLAYFTEIIDLTQNEASVINCLDEEFKPHVESGKFVRKEVKFERIYKEIGVQTIQNLYFSLPDEAWRIEELHKLVTAPYNPEKFYASEKRIGELLGYTEEAINHFIEKMYGKQVGGR